MGELYLRNVVLKIYPKQGPSKKIEKLRIKFRFEKTSEGNPNKGEIEVFNLSETTRSILESKSTRVALEVGYIGLNSAPRIPEANTNSTETIFIGNLTKTLNEVAPPDIITRLEIGDGDNRFRNARLTKGYPPNTKLGRVLDDLTEAFQLTKGAREGVPEKTYANGLALSGLVRDHFEKLTTGNGLQWSIQDETLQILPSGGATKDSIIVLSPSSGLIGSPIKTKQGIEFRSLIQPKLRPGRKVRIESRFVKGTYIIKKVVHEGDSHEGDFISYCTTTNLRGV